MVLLVALLTVAARGGPADDLLAAVDAAANQGRDAHLVLEVEATDERARAVSRTLEIWQRGDDQRLVRYRAPAHLAGIALLVPDGETLYLWLPSYGRARRVAGEARGSSFEGTDFAMEDLARMRWADDWAPALVGPDLLRLAPRPGVDASSARVDLWVRPDRLPARVEHYDEAGTLLRRITFSDVRPVDGRPLAHEVVVEDLARGRTSRARVTEADFDVGLTDDRFSLTSLSR